MQLTFAKCLLAHAACVTTVMLSLVGCNNSNAAGGAGIGSMADDSEMTSYVLITHMRPEAPEKYFKAVRWAYGVCVAIARGRKHEVIPFPKLEPDFVTERNIYASDGKRTMVRRVWYDLDSRKMTPENGCQLRPLKGWSTALASDGQERSGELDIDGQLHLATAEATPEEPVRASMLAMHKLPKRINGVPLKCNIDGSCIVDPTVVLIKEGYRPVSAAYRIDDVATHGTALIVEPISLTVGKPIDPAIFSVDKGD